MTKYRGFRKDGKGWIEGFLIGILDPEKEQDTYKKWLIHNGVNISAPIEVHKDSVGIFTGLTDKNGKEIFGSIDGSKGGDKIEVTTGFVGDVKFRNGSFIIENETGHFYYIGELISNLCYTIIGNQYEQNG